jgi:hypothetical protein
MAVPTSLADLSTTPASNPPAGSDAVFPLLDDHLRFTYSCLAQLRDLRAPLASPTFTGVVTAPNFTVDATFYASIISSKPTITLDIGDAIAYDRTANSLAVTIGSASVLTVGAVGPEVAADATTNNGLVRRSQAQSIATAAAAAAVSPQATETIAGIGEVATQAEADAITDDSRFITPKKLGNGFAYSAANPGYFKLPSWLGGFIIQWGVANVAANFVYDMTLPAVFPNVHLMAIGNLYATSNGAASSVNAFPSSTSIIRLVNNNGSNQNISFICIGR